MTNPTEPTFPAVLDALFNAPDVPVHLVYRLSDLSAEEMGQFVALWPAVNEERRTQLVRHMADIAEENYVVDFAPIFAYLFTDAAAPVRIAALDGMWDSEDTKLIDPIIGIMQRDVNQSVRAAAARGLAHFVLLAEWGQIPDTHTERVIAALLGEYERPTASEDLKRAALEAMASADTPRINDLILDAYETGSDAMQLSALFAMGGTADRRWLPTLIDELENPSPDFRAEAARAIGSIGETEAVAPLEQLLGDEEREVAMAAILALGQIGGDRATAILNVLLEDPEFEDLYDVIEESLEEMEWSVGGFDLLSFSGEDDEPEDGIYLN